MSLAKLLDGVDLFSMEFQLIFVWRWKESCCGCVSWWSKNGIFEGFSLIFNNFLTWYALTDHHKSCCQLQDHYTKSEPFSLPFSSQKTISLSENPTIFPSKTIFFLKIFMRGRFPSLFLPKPLPCSLIYGRIESVYVILYYMCGGCVYISSGKLYIQQYSLNGHKLNFYAKLFFILHKFSLSFLCFIMWNYVYFNKFSCQKKPWEERNEMAKLYKGSLYYISVLSPHTPHPHHPHIFTFVSFTIQSSFSR